MSKRTCPRLGHIPTFLTREKSRNIIPMQQLVLPTKSKAPFPVADRVVLPSRNHDEPKDKRTGEERLLLLPLQENLKKHTSPLKFTPSGWVAT